MKILYLSCHTILEYDEIKLFTEMGHEVFSMGAYQTANADNGIRPAVPNLYENQHLRAVSLQCSKENLHQELIDWCDIVIMMHNASMEGNHPQPWLANNWKKLKASKKPIIWRSIGQSTRNIEKSLEKFRRDDLKIVRYSPKEDTIPDYQGSDAMIRFYKDPEEYKDYVGSTERVVNVSQALFGGPNAKSRGDHMALSTFRETVMGLDWKVFGPDNEFANENNGGALTFEDLKTMLRFNRVYLYTGTRPASYTLAVIEAMMTGIPIISIGPALGNAIYSDQNTFEMAQIIGDGGEAGFWSDSVAELRDFCKRLLADQDLAIAIGKQGRSRAIALFGKETIRKQWEEFFKTL